ncbi:MAG: tetratricopeptide repeat protein [Proteobacteria bacterium]|jgi:tetratricopeptide (TPR) repeat protein|nr:tetratricopeptide repeat protein [Pseudomonadota bacterium]
MKSTGVQALLASLFALASALALAAEPRVVEIPVPDTSELESVVADQVNDGQRAVASILTDPQSSNADKARSIGTLGHLYHTYGFLDAAAAAYETAGLLDPGSFSWLYSAASVAQAQGQFALAIELYARALPLADSADLRYLVHLRTGEVLDGNGDPDGALAAYLAAYEINPDSPSILARLGRSYLDHKQYEQAAAHLGMALALNPEINALHYPLGLAYRGLGQRDLARQHMALRGTVDIQPSDPLHGILTSLRRGSDAYIAAGKTALDARRFEDAERLFRMAVESNPDQSSAWAHLATANIELDRPDQALTNIARAIELAPDNMTLHMVAGDLLIDRGEPDQAIRHLETFTQNSPENARGFALLARAYRDSNHAEAALTNYRQSVTMDPGQTRVWLELIALMEHRGEPHAALAANRQALASMPDDPALLARLVHSLTGSEQTTLEDARAALEIARQLFEAAPGYDHARLVAIAQAATGDCALAAQWMDRSIALAETAGVSRTIITALHLNRGLFASGTSCTLPAGR